MTETTTRPAELAWLVLTDTDQAGPRPGDPRPKRIAGQIALAALVVICLVAIGGSFVSKRVAERQSVHDVAELTDVLAQSAIQPALTDAMLTSPSATAAGLDALVHTGVLSSELIRVKLWTPEGDILYSDEARLIGQKFTLDDEARNALTRPATEASTTDLDRPENQFERGHGKLLEVYRPVWTPAGHPLLFETYFRYDSVSDRTHGLWRGFAGIILSSLAALILLLLPVVWSLLRRTRRAQEQEQAMNRRALESSDAERRRIAAGLHDGVVQQLVASSLDLAGRAERASAEGDPTRAADLGAAATTIRASIAGLRSLLVEIYPPNVAAAGLPAALRDLASTFAAGDLPVVLDLDDVAASQLSPEQSESFFRVTQEVLRNAAKHASASAVGVRVYAEDDWVYLAIDDDGVGFDAAAASREASLRAGHLGLQLIVDAARQGDAQLCLASQIGSGTHYRMAVAAS